MTPTWLRKKTYVLPLVIVCSISGVPPEEPVITRDGYVFERRLIEKAVNESGKCPVTHSPLSLSDLQMVMPSNVKNALPIEASSIPSLIELFRAEWDRVVTDQFNLKTELSAVQEELARALYEQEASVRVIARLTRERDEALSETTRLQEEIAQLAYSMEPQ